MGSGVMEGARGAGGQSSRGGGVAAAAFMATKSNKFVACLGNSARREP